MSEFFPLVLGICLCVMVLYLRHWLTTRFVSAGLRRAERLVARGRDIDKAIRIFSSVLAVDRSNARAGWALANIYFRTKQFILSQMYLTDISRHGRFTDGVTEVMVHEMLADIFANLGEFGKADAEYFFLRQRSVLPAPVMKKAIRMDLQSGRAKEAGNFLKEALKAYPEDGEFRYLSALAAFLRADLTSVEPEISAALRLGFVSDELKLLSAKICFIRGNYQSSLEHLQRLPPAFLDSAEVENMMGQCFFYLKDYNPAIGVLEKLIPELEKNGVKMLPDAMFILGCSYEASGNLENAKRIWQETAERFPFYSKAGQKLQFYSTVALSKELQDLIVCPMAEFYRACLELLDRQGFGVREHYQASEKSIDFVCASRKDLHPYHAWLVNISRHTSAVTDDVVSRLMRQMNNRKAQYLVMIAPWFEPETLAFCNRNLVTVHTFEIFLQKKQE